MSIAHINDLNTIFGSDAYLEARNLIQGAIATIGKDLYTRDEKFRLAAYAELIFQACEALLDDGGPAAALRLLKIAATDVRREAADRAQNQLGPFMEKEDLEDRLQEAVYLSAELKVA